jgi:hypothetical protein
MRRTVSKLAGLLAGASALCLAACSSEPAATLVGKKVDDYMLVDQTGMGHILKYDTLTPAIVLASYVNGDEGSRAAAKALEGAAAKHAGVVFHLINSAEADTRDTIAAEVKEAGITLPVLDDEFQLIGNSLGFTYAGEAVIVNPKTWEIVFHGPADKVEAALGEFVAGGKVATAEYTEMAGTKLTFADRGKDYSTISYSKDVVPILMDKCVDCHQPNGIAPWHMTNYQMVKTFAPMIREAIRRDRMPPFDADNHYRAFANNENLSADETKTLIHWIEAGAPSDIAEGGEDPLVKGVAGRPDWPLGEPDLIVSIPAYDVPAAGVVDYQIPAVKSPLTEGKWLKATTFKPATVRACTTSWLAGCPRCRRTAAASTGTSRWAATLSGTNRTSRRTSGRRGCRRAARSRSRCTTRRSARPSPTTRRSPSTSEDEAPELMKRQIVIADPSIEIQPNQARWHETAYVLFPADVQIYGVARARALSRLCLEADRCLSGRQRGSDPQHAALRLQLAARVHLQGSDRPARRHQARRRLLV